MLAFTTGVGAQSFRGLNRGLSVHRRFLSPVNGREVFHG